jgi:hypothetical protein
MELVYASGDKSDSVQNIMIKKCDQLAKKRIDEIEQLYLSQNAINELPIGYCNIDKIIRTCANV